MPMKDNFKGDHALYRRMLEPHESEDAANACADAFQKDVAALREKYRIAELLVVAQVNMMRDGEEVSPILQFSFGSRTQTPTLAAYAHGVLRADMDNMLDRLAKGKK